MAEQNHDHLDEFQLNEYLDGDLDPNEFAIFKNHLSDCLSCASRVEQLRGVIDELEDLPEISLSRDLSQSIVAALQPELRLPQPVKIGAITQMILALVVLVLAIPPLLRTWQPVFLEMKFTLSDRFSSTTLIWTGQLENILVTWTELLVEWQPPTILEATQIVVWPIFLAAMMLFVIGNGLILRKVIRNGAH
jgi:hypothetical protein